MIIKQQPTDRTQDFDCGGDACGLLSLEPRSRDVLKRMSEKEEERGMHTYEAVAGILASVLGAGIVFIPYTLEKVGFTVSFFLIIFAILVGQASVELYMRTVELLPFPVTTLYDLGYIVMRTRIIVYVIAFLQLIMACGLVICYLILFGVTAASIAETSSSSYAILKERSYWIIGVTLFLCPLFYKRKMGELAWVSLSLVAAFFLFLLCIVF
jgi:amino acid permease